MKRKIILAVTAAFALVSVWAQAPAPAPTKTELIEKVVAAPGESKIAYEKYRLPNGLTVIVHEDHSDPIVHVEVTYHVGSAREAAGKSGFAHFFEHMMFQGSVNVRDEEHFKIVQAAGGQMNGTTNRDRTNYFETLPSNYLETALWLEADRMGFLLDSVTQKKFEVQRATVKNEKGQNVDNQPYGKLSEVKDFNLYPPGHPYSWQTIGYVEDLDRVNVEDLKNFFMRWYGPNNASLVVAGDVNAQEVVRLAEKYFGPIARGPEVRKQRVEPFRLADTKYANVPDSKIFLPLEDFVWPTPPAYHPDDAALDVLAYVLGTGKNSLIYKNFEKAEKAVSAGANNYSSELAGEFSVQLVSFPFNVEDGSAREDLEKLLIATLDEFNKTGITDEDVTRALTEMSTGYKQALENVRSKAYFLSYWFYAHGGKPYNMNDEIARYSKVTKDDVMRVFRQYIHKKNYVKVNIFPKRLNAATNVPDESASSGSTIVNTQGSGELEYKGLSYTRPVDNFDRSKRPVAGPAKNIIVPEYWESKFDNGITLIGTRTTETPLVSISLRMKGGNYLMANDLSRTGLAVLTSSMMGEATQNMTGEQFDAAVRKLGSNISFFAGNDATMVQIVCEKQNLDATLKLFEEAMFRPKFTQADFKRIQNQIYQSIQQQMQSPQYMGSVAFNRQMFGAKSIQSYSASGTTKSVKSLSVKDVEEFYNKYYGPDYTNIVVVGDISQDEVIGKLSFLKSWAKKNYTIPALTPPVYSAPTQIFLVDKYKAPQSQLFVGSPAVPYDWNGTYYKSNIMAFALGGNFNSRLNLNLREDKGFTYGIYGGFRANDYNGHFLTNAGVRASATDSAVREIMYEINKYREGGITDEELAFTKSSLSLGEALDYESSFQKAGFLADIIEHRLPKDYQAQQKMILQGITKDDINKLAKELLPADKMLIVVVGDRDKVTERLKKLGYKVTEIKADNP